ncbi:Orf120b protein [Striga asiatica]|uniref:Orf120b protein n=1 Tax=Striga asiatica TaxID=4170 RepID=A0A5A7PWZ0_STRAF|nr:Orf120b protein [Striga asiatica]
MRESPRCTKIKLGNQHLNVVYQYEKLVSLCFYCGLVGHLERDCKTRLRHIEEGTVAEGQFGDWMKAVELGRNMGSSPPSQPSHTSNGHSNSQKQGEPSSATKYQAENGMGEGCEWNVALIPREGSMGRGEEMEDVQTSEKVGGSRRSVVVEDRGSVKMHGKEVVRELEEGEQGCVSAKKQEGNVKTQSGAQNVPVWRRKGHAKERLNRTDSPMEIVPVQGNVHRRCGTPCFFFFICLG